MSDDDGAWQPAISRDDDPRGVRNLLIAQWTNISLADLRRLVGRGQSGFHRRGTVDRTSWPVAAPLVEQRTRQACDESVWERFTSGSIHVH
jgi:hypothetical protein